MSNGHRDRGKVHARSKTQLALHPRSAQQNALLVLQSVGKIDDVAARLARHLPGIAGEGFVGGEEGEVHVLQVLRKHALDEGRLLAHRFELAERLVVIEQTDVLRRKIAVAEDVLQFAALQGAGAYDGYAKHAASMSSAGQNTSGAVWFIFIKRAMPRLEVEEAARWAGGIRRKAGPAPPKGCRPAPARIVHIGTKTRSAR